MRAAQHGDREGRGAIGQMEHRRRVQVDAGAGVADRDDDAGGVGHQVAVGQHHALGYAGGAAGVVDAGDVVVPRFELRRRRRFDQGLECVHAGRRGRVVQPIDVPHLAQPPLQRLHRRRHGGVHEQYRGTGIVEHVGDFRGSEPGVQRHRHAPRRRHGEQQFEIPVTVQSENGGAVALAKAVCLQSAGDACDPLGGVPPGEAAIAKNRRWRIRPRLQRALQALTQMHPRPPWWRLVFVRSRRRRREREHLAKRRGSQSASWPGPATNEASPIASPSTGLDNGIRL